LVVRTDSEAEVWLSESLYPYAVPAARLLAIPGSRDRKLLARVRKQYPLAGWVDEQIGECNETAEEFGEEGRIEVTFPEAVRRIVYGEPLIGADESFVYGFAYDAICRCLGRELPCAILPFDFDDLDASLAQLGIPLRVTALCFRGPVFHLPDAGEFPSIGCWTAEEMAAAKDPLDRVSVRGLGNVIASCVEQVRDWYPLLDSGDCVVGVLF
jgi:hypothetical protein